MAVSPTASQTRILLKTGIIAAHHVENPPRRRGRDITADAGTIVANQFDLDPLNPLLRHIKRRVV